MKTAILIALGVYLLGVLVAIVLLHKEVRNIYTPKSKFDLTLKVLKNTLGFYLSSLYGVGLIITKRSLLKRTTKPIVFLLRTEKKCTPWIFKFPHW